MIAAAAAEPLPEASADQRDVGPNSHLMEVDRPGRPAMVSEWIGLQTKDAPPSDLERAFTDVSLRLRDITAYLPSQANALRPTPSNSLEDFRGRSQLQLGTDRSQTSAVLT